MFNQTCPSNLREAEVTQAAEAIVSCALENPDLGIITLSVLTNLAMALN
jgi:inosine-uridine nucleoside N-ribohydrolase